MKIRHYHCDNGIFADNKFQVACNAAGQTISFFGVNAYVNTEKVKRSNILSRQPAVSCELVENISFAVASMLTIKAAEQRNVSVICVTLLDR